MKLADLSHADLVKLPSGSDKFRTQALDLFRKLETMRPVSEAWKYTSLRALNDLPLQLASLGHAATRSEISSDTVVEKELQALVCGTVRVEEGKLDISVATNGLHFSKLAHAELGAEDFASWTKAAESFPFLSWATTSAYLSLKLDDNVKLTQPLLLDHKQKTLAGESGFLNSSVLKFEVGQSARGTIVQHFSATIPEQASSNASLTSSVSQIAVGENAEVNWIVLQNESFTTSHLNHLHFHLSKGARVRVILLNLGASTSRAQVTCIVDGADASAELLGFSLGGNEQHHDINVIVEHTKPDGRSRQTFKGIYADKSRGVFSGTIHIHKDAQRTDSRQLSKNILIGRKSRVDTRPQLEIMADDVKANHGATIGRINEEEVFYLESRGIPRQDAVALVARGFGLDILSEVPDEKLRLVLSDLLNARMPGILSSLQLASGVTP
jgi:Fe-S cluster assembly protein SufD